MRAVDLLTKKRAGVELTTAEIEWLIQGYADGTVPDYQMAAWAMAVCLQGMTAGETADLALAMARSGESVDLSAIPGIKVDKHSTGGVGDKTTLVLVPLVAACGAPVAKMSGRALGHTGGTLDKLESIPGLRVELSRDDFLDQVRRVGAAVVGQTGHLVPADKRLYGLRDVTGTVDSIPLIAASVMSKKIAGGANAVVLDVKVGTGAFMRAVDDAFRLAEAMVAIGTQVGMETVAVVSDMNQPLGQAVGNALEVQEAIETLRGFGPPDLEQLCLELGSRMLMLAGRATAPEEARRYLLQVLRSGKALAKLKEMVAAQGGDVSYVNQPVKLPRAPVILAATAPGDGVVTALDALEVGRVVADLGAGRTIKDEPIDLSVGVVLQKKVGDRARGGETLALIHAPTEAAAASAAQRLITAYRFGTHSSPARPLIHGTVTRTGTERHAGLV